VEKSEVSRNERPGHIHEKVARPSARHKKNSGKNPSVWTTQEECEGQSLGPHVKQPQGGGGVQKNLSLITQGGTTSMREFDGRRNQVGRHKTSVKS